MRKSIWACTALVVGAAALVSCTAITEAQTVAPTTSADIPDVPADPNVAPAIRGQNVDGMRIFIRAGLKTHGPGLHEYPQFLADWSTLLTQQGTVVDGALHFPSDADLENVDVMLIYKGASGYLTPAEKATLDAFVKRGGGIVTVHDVLSCGCRATWTATSRTNPSGRCCCGASRGLAITPSMNWSITFSRRRSRGVAEALRLPVAIAAGRHAGREVTARRWQMTSARPICAEGCLAT